MLQKYSIMPHAIILCLLGLTLMTASPVFAQQNITPPCLTLEQCRDEVTQMGERVADLLAQVGVVLTGLESKANEVCEIPAHNEPRDGVKRDTTDMTDTHLERDSVATLDEGCKCD